MNYKIDINNNKNHQANKKHVARLLLFFVVVSIVCVALFLVGCHKEAGGNGCHIRGSVYNYMKQTNMAKKILYVSHDISLI